MKRRSNDIDVHPPVADEAQALVTRPNPFPRSVYVHVPFCRHRCGYCNFSLVANRDHLVDRYLRALDNEIARFTEWGTFSLKGPGPHDPNQPLNSFETGNRPPLDTLYLGGGTPSHLNDQQLDRLFNSLRRVFSWGSATEVTLEANPMDFQRDRAAALTDFGVNRISLGVQSFDDQKLKRLDRDHSAEQVLRSVDECLKVTDNLSIDLIFAAPAESLSTWEQDLQRAISLPIQHLSTYELTFEKGTLFWNRQNKGQLRSLDDELRLAMYEGAITQLSAAGLRQYEISSFARTSRESRHNQVYWSGLDYWAFGPGASGYVQGLRYGNVASPTRYLKLSEGGEPLWAFSEQLAPADKARELLAIGLRRLDGLSHFAFQSLTGLDWMDIAGQPIRQLHADGYIQLVNEKLSLTRVGVLFYDHVAAEILSTQSSPS